MATQAPLPLTGADMSEELHQTVHHLCGMLRTVKRIRPNGPAAAVSVALETHLKKLTTEALGLPDVWEDHAARIEAKAIAELEAESGNNSAERSA